MHSALIALIKYSNGTYSYILASKTLKFGLYTYTAIKPLDLIEFKLFSSCSILLQYVKYSFLVFNIEPYINSGGKYVRAAGVFAKIINIDHVHKNVRIKLPSSKIKILPMICYCNLGRVSNMLHYKEIYANAGFSRNRGYRPITRGVAKNPVDHPHGGRTKTNSPTKTP
jgi:large subunit ribosomal protein L2